MYCYSSQVCVRFSCGDVCHQDRRKKKCVSEVDEECEQAQEKVTCIGACELVECQVADSVGCFLCSHSRCYTFLVFLVIIYGWVR